MRGDTEVLALLNEQLTSELTAINQYIPHAKMQANWGLTELATHTRAESFEEMRHAEAITDRILLLEGLPNYQRLFSLQIGQTVREQFEGDLATEVEVVDRLRPGIAMCRDHGDATSARVLETILADEEHHIDYLQTQLELMDKLQGRAPNRTGVGLSYQGPVARGLRSLVNTAAGPTNASSSRETPSYTDTLFWILTRSPIWRSTSARRRVCRGLWQVRPSIQQQPDGTPWRPRSTPTIR